MYFRYFVIISPWKRVWLIFCRNLNLRYPRMLCAKFGWNWPSGSGENENVKNLKADGRIDDGRQIIRKAQLSYQLRWAKKGVALYLIKLQLVEIGPVVLEKSQIWKVYRLTDDRLSEKKENEVTCIDNYKHCIMQNFDRLIDNIVFYVVSAIFRPYNGGCRVFVCRCKRRSLCRTDPSWGQVEYISSVKIL